MKVCNNCEKEYSADMNYCELCGEQLAEISNAEAAEPTESPKEEKDEFDSFFNEMCSVENREVLKELISGTGVEWFGKNKEFLREVMVKFAEFKAKKGNPPVY